MGAGTIKGAVTLGVKHTLGQPNKGVVKVTTGAVKVISSIATEIPGGPTVEFCQRKPIFRLAIPSQLAGKL